MGVEYRVADVADGKLDVKIGSFAPHQIRQIEIIPQPLRHMNLTHIEAHIRWDNRYLVFSAAGACIGRAQLRDASLEYSNRTVGLTEYVYRHLERVLEGGAAPFKEFF